MEFAIIKYQQNEYDPYIVQICTEGELEKILPEKSSMQSFAVIARFEADLLTMSMGVSDYFEEYKNG